MSCPASCGEKGFTPVELLVSLAVIGVVAAVGVLALLQVTVAGRHQADRADRQVLESAEEAWAAHQSAGPVAEYATETVLVSESFLKKASVRNLVCLTPAGYFVLAVRPPGDRAAGDAACTAEAGERQLPGPATASAGTAHLP